LIDKTALRERVIGRYSLLHGDRLNRRDMTYLVMKIDILLIEK